jgi:threonine dehydratase
MDKPNTLPTYADIAEAAMSLRGQAIQTPLLRSDLLDTITGARVFIKPENLQLTGSFKFRGAYNAISRLGREEKKMGILAVSSGNHAQGIAEAARRLKVEATILMPADAPRIKLERTKRSGAKVILFDRVSDDREAMVLRLAHETGATFIHPYDNGAVLAGQGTCGLEICLDLQKRGIAPDHVLVCTGGGGLTAGVALALKHHFPSARVHSCEPEGFDDYRRSLISGKPETNPAMGGSVCDAILTPSPGRVGFAINKGLLGEGFAVQDEEALGAVAFAFNELKLVVEPGGAVSLAALLQQDKRFAGKTVVIILTGGNIDPEILARALL